MVQGSQSWWARMVRAGAARQWSRHADSLMRGRRGGASPELRDEALELHGALARYLQLADKRMLRDDAALDLLDLPPGTDWRWRPLLLRGKITPPAMAAPQHAQALGDELTLYHDCPHQALILRQSPNLRATDLAPYGVVLEILGFAGSYLSLSLDLPPELNESLGRNHVLRLDATLHSERPITVYGRLNVAQGPNTETVLRQLGHPIEGRDCRRAVEFDLGYADLSQRPVDKVWLDLIFEAPYMNCVSLTDAVLSRHPRAEM